MQLILTSIRAYYRGVIGCQTNKRDVMLSFMHSEDSKVVHDLFLTQEQAIELLVELTRAINLNKTTDANGN